MANYTANLKLYKKDPIADKNDTFNIRTMLNENWDKLDKAVGEKADKKYVDNVIGGIDIDVSEDIENHNTDENAHEDIRENIDEVSSQLNDIATVELPKKADYEEGLWTPILYGRDVAGTNTYSIQTGRYIKINNKVTCYGYIVLSSKDVNMEGFVRIGGLPIPGSNVRGSAGFGDIRNITVPTGGIFPQSYVADTFADIFFARSGTTPIGLSPSDIKNNAGLIFTIEYYLG